MHIETGESQQSKQPKYLAIIEHTSHKYEQFRSFMKNGGKRFIFISVIATLALVGLAYIANLKMGSSWYNLLIISTLIIFVASLWQAKLVVDNDAKRITVPIWRRKLVLMNLISSSIGILSITTLSTVSKYSFLSQDISSWSIISSVSDIFAKNENKVVLLSNAETSGAELSSEFDSEFIFNSREAQEEGAPILVKRVEKKKTRAVSEVKGDKVFQEINYRFFLRNFMEREGFSPKRYWDKSQWSIGFGSRSSANDNRVLTRTEAYKEAQKELEECRAKAKKDFPWLSYNQELVLMDLYYNAGKSSITGLKGIKTEGGALYELNKFKKNPNSITLNDLYSAFVADKSCKACEQGKKCGHQERKRRNALQFLANRSDKDLAIFLAEYNKLIKQTNSLALNQ